MLFDLRRHIGRELALAERDQLVFRGKLCDIRNQSAVAALRQNAGYLSGTRVLAKRGYGSELR